MRVRVYACVCVRMCACVHICAFGCTTNCNTLQHPATSCNTLQHPATPCNTLQHPKHYLQSTLIEHPYLAHTSHCNTLQHTATPCNTLQHPARSLQRTLIEHPYLAHTFLLANPPNCVGGEIGRVRERGRENVCSRHQKIPGLLRFFHPPCDFSYS